MFSPKFSGSQQRYLVFVSTTSGTNNANGTTKIMGRGTRLSNGTTVVTSTTTNERQLCRLDLKTMDLQPLLRMPSKRRMDSDLSNHSSSQGSIGSGHSISSIASGGAGNSAPAVSSPGGAANGTSGDTLSLEERLRRERQRLNSSGGLTQFSWCWVQQNKHDQRIPPPILRLLVPIRGSLYVQDGMDSFLKPVYDKHSLQPPTQAKNTGSSGAIDPQLSPNGALVAFCVYGEIYVTSASATQQSSSPPLPTQVTYGADLDRAITHGLADFVAQEEMDRYRGFWWAPDSSGILFARVNESEVPPYRITHHDGNHDVFEDHRYPFAGKNNPKVQLGFVPVDASSIVEQTTRDPSSVAQSLWQRNVTWWDPPREAQEYLARVQFLPDGTAITQWQNRAQNCLVLQRLDPRSAKSRTLLIERSEVWINLHHMLHVLERPIHPKECASSNGGGATLSNIPDPLPYGSFSFLFASERSGFSHIYLYTYVPGYNSGHAMMLRQVSSGPWMVEGIVGVDLGRNAVYFTGTYDSVLERHLYVLPILTEGGDGGVPMDTSSSDISSSSPNSPNGVRRGLKSVMNVLSGKSNSKRSMQSDSFVDVQSSSPIRLTPDSGMHSIVMDPDCTMFVDTSSDLGRPTSVKIYDLPGVDAIDHLFSASPATNGSVEITKRNSRNNIIMTMDVKLRHTLYDAIHDDTSVNKADPGSMLSNLPPPELMTFPCSDGTETLHAAMYKPDPRIHGPGPYPLVCAVYGGPHVQRVNRSWSQCADMRAQRLRSLGFCVLKCDNRGSSRRGIKFESSISRRLGRLEVLDQVAAVRHLTVRGIADPTRVGIYGWSYGGYLAAMCLCRAPDVFHVAVAGAPVTSWDGYDTHYTERYMGLPSENPNGYRESAVFDHIPNMRGRLLLVHGLIDENVHFRHTARLINRLIASGKDYDLLLFPDERHSPRRLRDRIYMEQRISDYFSKHLGNTGNIGGGTHNGPGHVRTMAGL